MRKKDRVLMLVVEILEGRGREGILLNELEKEVWRSEKEMFRFNRVYCKSYVMSCILELDVVIENKKVVLLDEYKEELKEKEDRSVIENGDID